MDALYGMRKKWHQRVLNRYLQQPQIRHHSINFNTARKIGILFEGTELAQREPVIAFSEKLKALQKSVKLLAYIDNRLDAEGFVFKSFNRKELDWLLRPRSEEALEFMNTSFDILINFSLKEHLPLEYLAACSKAHFRVGPFTAHTYCYELMIDLPAGKGLPAFIEQVEIYLNKMQSTHEAAAV